MADVRCKTHAIWTVGKDFKEKTETKLLGFVRLTFFFFFFLPRPLDVQRVNPSAFVSRCVASTLAACPSCVLTPQLHRTVTLEHKKACKARWVNASCLRPRSFEPVPPTGILLQTHRQSCRKTKHCCLLFTLTIAQICGTIAIWA